MTTTTFRIKKFCNNCFYLNHKDSNKCTDCNLLFLKEGLDNDEMMNRTIKKEIEKENKPEEIHEEEEEE